MALTTFGVGSLLLKETRHILLWDEVAQRAEQARAG